jgi:hypothetical protein
MYSRKNGVSITHAQYTFGLRMRQGFHAQLENTDLFYLSCTPQLPGI